jgi:hypothetical protein
MGLGRNCGLPKAAVDEAAFSLWPATNYLGKTNIYKARMIIGRQRGAQTHDATGREISLTISGILGSALSISLAKLGH